jgi:hypothetical protein
LIWITLDPRSFDVTQPDHISPDNDTLPDEENHSAFSIDLFLRVDIVIH